MRIHPTAVVTEDVRLGADVVVGPHAVVLGPCTLGDGVRVGPGSVLGTPPEITSAAQNDAWAGEPAHHGVEVGAGTVVREHCTVQQGSTGPTILGAGCWLLSGAYVAHDCVVGDGVTLSAGSALGGYVRVGARATLGMRAAVHQRRVVGAGAMVGMSAAVTRDVPPFAMAYGTPAVLRGANVVGLARWGVPEDQRDLLDIAYGTGRVPDPAGLDPAVGAALADWWAQRPQRPPAAPAAT